MEYEYCQQRFDPEETVEIPDEAVGVTTHLKRRNEVIETQPIESVGLGEAAESVSGFAVDHEPEVLVEYLIPVEVA